MKEGFGIARLGLASEFDLRLALRTLWRRRWLLMAVLALTIGATWIILTRVTPIYTATANVMMDTRRTRVIDIKEVMTQLQPHLVTVLSEVEVVRSRTIAQRVAVALNLFEDVEFNPALRPRDDGGPLRDAVAWLAALRDAWLPRPPPPEIGEEARQARARAIVVDAVEARLAVAPVPQSLVIRISYNSSDPAKAARIANAFAEQYVLDQLEAKFEATRRASSWLNTRLDSLRQAVVESERQVATYRSESGLIESRGLSGSQQQLGELGSQLILAQAKRAETEARVVRIETLLKSNRGMDAVDEVLDSPLVQRLREQEAELSRQFSDLSTRYGEKHPRMIKLRAEQVEIKAKIASEVGKLAQALRNELAVLHGRESGLATQIRKIEATVHAQNSSEIRLRELEREAQANRLLYESFLARFKETSEQERIQQPDARIISSAETPRSPSHPRRLLLLSASSLIGLMLATMLVFLIEQLDNTFRSREQLEDATGLPALGLVPQIRRVGGVRTENYQIERPSSSYAEAFRSVWITLKHAGPDAEARIIVVTSSLPDEGKSLTALSLARTAAALGARVMLLDCDLRRSSVDRMLAITPEHCITDVIAGTCTLEEAVVSDQRGGIHVLPARRAERPRIELLGSDEMRALLARLRREYDLVVIDSPPTLPVSDVQVLARLADRAIFCVRWDKTPREVVLSALRMLHDVKADLAGTLLTRVNVSRHARYGYGDMGHYYGRYRSYYAD